MKLIGAIFLSLSLTVLSFQAVSQTTDEIVGKWTFKDVNDKGAIDSVGLKMLYGMFGEFSIYINPNGRYQVKLFSGEKGDWSYISGSGKLFLTSDKGTKSQVVLGVNSAKQLVYTFGPKKSILLQRTTVSELDDIGTAPAGEVLVPIKPNQLCKTWYFKGRISDETENKERVDLLFQDNIQFEFNLDGTYSSKVGSLLDSGTWQLENLDTQLVLTGLEGTRYWQVKKVGDTTLELQRGKSVEVWKFSTLKNN